MKKYLFLILVSIVFASVAGFWTIVSKGYDKQNEVILFLKKIIPTNISRKVRDTVFIIPSLKEKNRELKLQVAKYEQGLEGNLFFDEELSSKNKNYNFNLKQFFLPFKRLDLSLGWNAKKNSKRAHYLEIIEDKIIVISGNGETIYFNKKNIDKTKLNQTKISNNLESIFLNKKSEFLGIRDLYYEDNYIFISVIEKEVKGHTLNIYRAPKNFKQLNFEIFFKTQEYSSEYTLQTGGRIEKYKDNKILLSLGFFNDYDAAQNLNSKVGKIISINKDSKEIEVLSLGHRNPQGLFFHKEKNLIINSEHGPVGGDEVNLNFLDKKLNIIKNYGWPISSYGKPYPGTEDIYKKKNLLQKTHSENGFEEPIKYFSPSIGISEIFYVKEISNKELSNKLFVSSLRASSIYIIGFDQNMDKVEKIDRVYFENNRIRDLKFDNENELFFILFESTPALGVLKIS